MRNGKYTITGIVQKETAIDKYLNAMTKLYEECIARKHFNNRILFAILPFESLKSEVKEKLKDNYLKEKETLDAINDKDADKILSLIFRTKAIISNSQRYGKYL